MTLGLLGVGLFVGIVAMALPKGVARQVGINGMWLIAAAYPALFAILNDRAIYASEETRVSSPLMETISLVAHAGVIACCVLLLLRVGRPGDVDGQKPVRHAILLYLGTQAVIIVAHGSWEAARGWLVVLLVLLVAAAGYEPVEKVEKRLRWIFRVYVVGSLGTLVVAPDWALVPPEKTSRALFGFTERLIGLTDGSNYMGLVASIAFALECGAMMRRTRFSSIFAAAAAVACLLTQSRTPLIAVGLVALIYAGRRLGLLDFSRPAGSWAMRLTLAASAAVPIAVATAEFMSMRDELEKFTTGRFSIWVWSLQEIAENPIFGQGHWVFTNDYWMAHAAQFPTPANNGHNQVLETLVRGGVVEGVGFAFMVFALLGLAMRVRPHRYGETAVLLGAVLFTQLVFGTPFRMAGITWNLIQLAAFLAIAVAALRHGALDRPKEALLPGGPPVRRELRRMR